MSKKILLLDRTGGETDDDCGQAFYWNRLYGDGGIVAAKESIYLTVGRESHQDLAMVAEMTDISAPAVADRIAELVRDLTAEDRLDTQMMEVLYRRLGWCAAFALFMEPELRERYDTVHIEDELILDREPLWVPVTPDRVLRSKADGKLYYWEYKSTVSTQYKWVHSWPFAIQPHIGMAAIGEELGVPVEYTQIVGLYKGYDGVDGLNHPFVWAWRHVQTGEWTHEYAKATPRDKWERAPVWDYPGGVVGWVTKLGKEVCKAQFPLSVPVFLNEPMLADWVTRKKHRMQMIESYKQFGPDMQERLHPTIFEKRTKKCRPAFGDGCPYLPLCWNASNAANPLGSGFVPRVPHHEVEIMWREEQKRNG